MRIYDAAVFGPRDAKMTTQDRGLLNAVAEIAGNPIETIIETGTFTGEGSTLMLAKFFNKHATLKQFFTMECDWAAFSRARENLASFPWITPLYGLSVAMREAEDTVCSDEIINHPEKFGPDSEGFEVFGEGPPMILSAMYKTELNGGSLWIIESGAQKSELARYTQPFLDSTPKMENILRTLINQYRDGGKMLFLLDSCGGIGKLEFDIVRKLMGGRNYFMILDDTDSIKHYRSLRFIQSHPEEYRIIGLGKNNRWVAVEHLKKKTLWERVKGLVKFSPKSTLESRHSWDSPDMGHGKDGQHT